MSLSLRTQTTAAHDIRTLRGRLTTVLDTLDTRPVLANALTIVGMVLAAAVLAFAAAGCIT